ncbi:hypothetical protein [Streptomyces sp. NPDC096193]|uniref:hypothetical protein n=1 Tax=Streptomyces sp. NPDC096193 TaxID=3155821 RepID=UPI00331A218D
MVAGPRLAAPHSVVAAAGASTRPRAPGTAAAVVDVVVAAVAGAMTGPAGALEARARSA